MAVSKPQPRTQPRKQLATNSHPTNYRQAFIDAMRNQSGDQLHAIDRDYGYPTNPTFQNYYYLYQRSGIAKTVVEKYPDMCWSTNPMVKVGDDKDDAFYEFANRLKLFDRVRALDIKQRVGQYAGFYVRVRDNKQPSEPIGKISNANAIVELMPLYESQLQVSQYERDPISDRYGQPVIYQLDQAAVGGVQAHSTNSVNIHHSRVIIAAEGSDNDWIYGTPALESVFNSLLDLRKISGAGAEGFYKNAAQNIVFNLQNPEQALESDAVAKHLSEFNEQFDNFSLDRMRRSLWSPGLESKVLESSLADPKNHYMNCLYDVAAGSQIPATVLIGQQTGRLASDEDMKLLRHVAQARRLKWCTELLSDVINYFVNLGALQSKAYQIEFDDLTESEKSEKLESAKIMSEINEKAFRSGQELPFSSEQIAHAAGLDFDDLDIGGESGSDE